MAHTTTGQDRNLAGLIGWFLLLGAAIALFTGLDDPRLATPALTDMAAWGDWAAGNDPIMVTVSIMRLLLIGLTWYLLGATTIQVIARLTRSMAMMRIANALSVPLVRRVVSTTLGMGLAASMVAGATGTAVSPTPSIADTVASAVAAPTQATMQRTGVTAGMQRTGVTAGRQHTGVAPGMQHTGPNAATMQHTDRAATMQHTDRSTDAPTTAAAGAAMTRVDAASAGDGIIAADDAATMVGPQDCNATVSDDDTGPTMLRTRSAVAHTTAVGEDHATWTVRSGDHLWHIAATVMGEHLDRRAADDEVTPYWTRLIEANRDRLPDPDNPDLVLPGLVLTVPSPGVGAD